MKAIIKKARPARNKIVKIVMDDWDANNIVQSLDTVEANLRKNLDGSQLPDSLKVLRNLLRDIS